MLRVREGKTQSYQSQIEAHADDPRKLFRLFNNLLGPTNNSTIPSYSQPKVLSEKFIADFIEKLIKEGRYHFYS